MELLMEPIKSLEDLIKDEKRRMSYLYHLVIDTSDIIVNFSDQQPPLNSEISKLRAAFQGRRTTNLQGIYSILVENNLIHLCYIDTRAMGKRNEK
jgi:hypothetical protein